MRGSLPESPSNIFLMLGESASVPVTPHRQEEKSQQPRLAAWTLVWAELRAQESVLGTADMFERIGRSQTRMSVSAAWKPRRVGPLHPEGAGRWVGWRQAVKPIPSSPFPSPSPGVKLPWSTAWG